MIPRTERRCGRRSARSSKARSRRSTSRFSVHRLNQSRATLDRHLHIAPAAIGSAAAPSRKWSDLSSVANHPKFYMIDDKVFYIGSHNMYPPVQSGAVALGVNQEFGFIVENAAAAKTVLDTYWQPRWTRARPFLLRGLQSLKGGCSYEQPPSR